MEKVAKKDERSLLEKITTLLGHVLPIAVFNVLIPILIYNLAKPYTGEVWAVFLSGVIPTIKVIISFFVYKKQDAISVMQLLGVTITLVLTFTTSSGKMLILAAQGTLVVIGIFTMFSIYIFKEDLFFQLRRTLSTRTDEEMDALYAHPIVQETSRKLTVVMGISSVIQAILSSILVLILPLDTFIYVSNIIPLATLPLLYCMYKYMESKEAGLSNEADPLVKTPPV